MPSPITCYRFGSFQLLPDQRQLLTDGRPVKLGSRALDLLLTLVHRHDRVVSKSELLDLVWPGVAVGEANLAVQVRTLRQVLARGAISTVSGRGYRFVWPVETAESLRPTASPGRAPATASAEDAGSDCPPVPRPGAAISQPTQHGNLPERTDALIGREQDHALLLNLVASQRTVTLHGGAGVGKTRLALSVAAALRPAFPDGLWWVELAAVTDPRRVADAVAQVLRVALPPQKATRADPAPDAVARTLANVLRHGRVLLVLDNAEHLHEGVLPLLAQLQQRAPALHVLVTSQQPLRLPGEQCLRLPPLSLPHDASLESGRRSGAVALFVNRARALSPRFALQADNCAAVAEICRRLDGIPLAIELAAARLPLLGPEGLRERLDQRLQLLARSTTVARPHHQTLMAALSWSHGLLPDDAQRVFRRLGVFAGGFTLESAQHVAQDGRIDAWAVLNHLGSLVDRSLVETAEGGARPRYRLLESARFFALDRLAEAGELAEWRERHARALDALLTVPSDDARVWRTPPAAPEVLVAEVDNVRVALDWAAASGDDALALSLAAGASHAFLTAKLNAEYLSRVLPLRGRVRPDTPPRTAGRFWSAIAFAAGRNAHPAGLEAGHLAMAAWRAVGDLGRVYDALTWTVAIGARRGQLEPLQALIDEGRRIERDDWPPAVRSSFRWAQYRWLQMQGRTPEALQAALQQADLLAQAGNWAMHVAWGANVADCELALHRLAEAEAHARHALHALDALGVDENIVGHVMDAQVVALVLLGRVDEARPVARRARRLLEREGDALRLLEPLAIAAEATGRHADAARIMGHVDAAMARSGETRWPSAGQRWTDLQRSLAARLDEPVLREWLRAGAALTPDEAFALALGE